MFDKLKTIVARSAANKGQSMMGNALSTQAQQGGQVPQQGFQQFMSQAIQLSQKLFEEKEWQCPCGHKFRAHGEWIACAPIYCEVPNCPNPRYYVDGPGRALLEANPSGVRLEQVDPSKSLPTGSGKTTTNSMAGRFGPKK